MSGEHFDVVVVGAGISGIGAGHYLKRDCPDRSFAILEGRADLGGTWDLFRYPGIRSDSDMHTLGYSFKPWVDEKTIADASSIMEYLRETVDEFGIQDHIRFNQLVTRAVWDSKEARWTLSAKHLGEVVTYTCNFLFMCSGYYSYKTGHVVEFPGQERFQGEIVHPQKWPEDLDYKDKRVIVIGSGATAVTLVPAMASDTAHLTMLQRSPSYVASAPATDPINKVLRRILPSKVAYAITRKKNITLQKWLYERTRKRPDGVKKLLLSRVRKELGPDYDVDKHFTPSYNPWDQRLCLVPDSDLFEALKSGKASVVTDTIQTFTETGIQLDSGEKLEADIIITATGIELVTVGEIDFEVDGAPIDFAQTWSYKGIAYSDVPNMVSTFGYINASWTLRADLTCEYVCRLLNHMKQTGTDQCTPRLRPSDEDMPKRPWIDDFSAGYMQRAMHLMPRQGDRAPWLNTQSYAADKKLFRQGPVDDGVMNFSRSLASTD
jgi:monooxygenase